MTDYTRGTGSAGTLIIRDEGDWVSFWLRCDDGATNVGSASWSGSANGSRGGSFGWPSGGGTRRIGGPWLVQTSQTVSFGIGATGTQGLGGPTSFSVSINRARPTAPFGLSISRVSDSQQTLNWSRFGGYSSQVIQRRESSGSGWGSWQQIASINGTAITYSDRGTRSGRRYEYRLAAKAPSGQSGWSNLADIYTTPNVPTGASALRSGANIVVNVATQGYAGSFDVRDGSTVVATNVSLPWTHVSPNPATAHTYTVRGRRGSLLSAYSSASNTVQLVAPPNAPTGLSPNGGVRASDEDVTFTWVHNPVDSSDQAEYELRYREPEGSWTTLGGTVESSRAVELDAATFEWQARTKGEHPTFSPWSSTAVFAVIDRPGVAVTSPEDTWDSSTLTVEWSWLQEQGRPQSAWEVELFSEFGGLVDRRSGGGAASSATLGHRVTEGEWTVNVRAATGDVWSVWASQTFTVVFDAPEVPLLGGMWDESQGGVGLEVEAGGPKVPVADRTNLIPRPTPVDAADWYITGGTRALDSVFVRRPGVPALRNTVTTTQTDVSSAVMLAPGLASLTDAIPVAPGETYTVSAYTSASIAGYRSRFQLTWVDAAGAVIETANGAYTTGGVVGQWHRPRMTSVAPAGAAFLVPTLTVSPSSGNAPIGTHAWLTDGLMEEGSTVGEWFSGELDTLVVDGVERRVIWNGTPNESSSSTTDFVDTVRIVVERSVDGGDTWEVVVEVAEYGNLIDWESLSYGDTLYRATAFTAEGATAMTELTVEARSGSIWLSGGAGFGVTCRLPYDPGVQVTAGRQRALKQYAGRSLPVAYTGEALSRVVSASGTVMQRSDETATVEELNALAQVEQDVFLFRDPDGRRIYGSVGEIQLPRQTGVTDDGGFNAYWGYSFTLTETVRGA